MVYSWEVRANITDREAPSILVNQVVNSLVLALAPHVVLKQEGFAAHRSEVALVSEPWIIHG